MGELSGYASLPYFTIAALPVGALKNGLRTGAGENSAILTS
jgi:hypothetical protein